MTEAKIPTNAKGLRIKHFASMSYVPQEKAENEKELDESESLLFLAEFTGLGYNKMLDFT
jgi:hypothetical protein